MNADNPYSPPDAKRYATSRDSWAIEWSRLMLHVTLHALYIAGTLAIAWVGFQLGYFAAHSHLAHWVIMLIGTIGVMTGIAGFFLFGLSGILSRFRMVACITPICLFLVWLLLTETSPPLAGLFEELAAGSISSSVFAAAALFLGRKLERGRDRRCRRPPAQFRT